MPGQGNCFVEDLNNMTQMTSSSIVLYYEYYICMSFNFSFYTSTYHVLFGVQVVDLFLTFVRKMNFQANLTAHLWCIHS